MNKKSRPFCLLHPMRAEEPHFKLPSVNKKSTMVVPC